MRSSTNSTESISSVDNPEEQISKCHHSGSSGSLSIVSIGPGSPRYMIPEAFEALQKAEIIVGYRTYIYLIKDLFPSKTFVSKGMRQETERCRIAIEHALSGKTVALISSGDAGIYGMAGLALELCKQADISVRFKDTETSEVENSIALRIIPGVSALNIAASILGAPIMHDFAVVSLSDHLTPWELITKRLHLASQGDFVIILYNPRSATRPHLLEKAITIIKEHRSSDTPVGIVWRAAREGQRSLVCSLASIPIEEVDMHSVIIVGNSQTYVWNNLMVTPRGYPLEKLSKLASESVGSEDERSGSQEEKP
ncbi:MAG: precorrin-3B C(17)-methyltransferase [Syntrophobacterales bacterium]|nr:precorrin-3B C(17)-methyltransferase [Syntrophobacterales bacterium]